MLPNPYHLLLFEDDVDDVALLKEALDNTHHTFCIDVAMDGEEAMKFINSIKSLPDLVILDLNLPKKNGLEILRMIKLNERWNDVPVVILTTSSSAIDRAFCLNLGAHAFISKPSSVDEIESLVAQILKIAAVIAPRLSRLMQ